MRLMATTGEVIVKDWSTSLTIVRTVENLNSCMFGMITNKFKAIAFTQGILNVLLGFVNPRYLHTTCPSSVSKPFSDTVPHSPFPQYSTLPSTALGPPRPWSWMLPSMHGTMRHKYATHAVSTWFCRYVYMITRLLCVAAVFCFIYSNFLTIVEA